MDYSAVSDVDFDIKDEVQAMCSSPPPQPLEGLNSLKPPPFLTKTYDMVEDPHTDSVVSWSKTNNSFVVWNSHQFSTDLLPKYFKHNNFSSFVRQLNTYGFRKVDPDKWEFANEGFLRGQKHLLKHIQRRRPPFQGQQYQQGMGPCVEVGQFGMDREIERLRRDKNVLMVEVVRLRQQQQSTRNELQAMGNRIRTTEQRQQQTMTFLARAMRNPTFLSQLVQKNQLKQHLAGAKKRRRLLQGADSEECQSQISSFQAQAETLPQTQGQRQIVKYHSSYTILPPEPTVADTSMPLEAFLSTLGKRDEHPTEEDASPEAPFHDRAEEGLVSSTDFEQLEAQGFEHGSLPFHTSVPPGVAMSCSRDNHDDTVRAESEDLDLKTADVFWEELLGEEFDSEGDSEGDSEIETEPTYPPSS